MGLGFWWPLRAKEARRSVVFQLCCPYRFRMVDNASLCCTMQERRFAMSLSLSCVPLFAVRTRQQPILM